jgi:3-isopropylmalate dehydrogenase
LTLDRQIVPERRWSEQISGPLRPRNGTPVIGVLEGDGIGQQLISLALEVLTALEETGGLRFDLQKAPPVVQVADPESLAAPFLDFCGTLFAGGGALLAGPVGGRLLYKLRRELGLYCKISPIVVFEELSGATRIKPEHLRHVDVLVLRENTNGAYQGTSEVSEEAAGRIARHTFWYTEMEVRRFLDAAARIAATRRGRLTVVAKPGGLPAMTELWSDCAAASARAAGVQYALMHVDHAAYSLVQHAPDFDVIAAPNLFGDILSDIGAVLLGARGLSYGGSFRAEPGAHYQTNHGGANDLVGSDRANPVGQILSLAMLLRESFGLFGAARLIEDAVRAVWRDGWRTPDLTEARCRLAGTRQMGDLIIDKVRILGRG